MINETPRILSKLIACASLLVLAGCASAADPTAMSVSVQATDRPFPQPLQHAMCVRDVTGGEKTNPLWASKVDNEGFKAALNNSLGSTGLAAADDASCHYKIDVNLLGLSQPGMGFDMKVTSHVNYKVYDATGQAFVLETIDAPYTATVGDAFVGVERLKLANEGSIRVSIQMFFDKLRDSKPK